MFKHLAAFFVIAVLFIGCSSKPEECIAPAIDKNLVGTWKAVVIEDSKEYTIKLTKYTFLCHAYDRMGAMRVSKSSD